MQNLKEQALEALEFSPALKEVHVTADGIVFISKNDAKVHANSLEDKTVATFTREDVFGIPQETLTIPTKADELILFANAQIDIALLTAILDDEKRTTVIEAIKLRIAELEALNS